MTSETRTFTGLGSNNYTFHYSYNPGGQLTQAQYVAPSFSKNINYAYNSVGALQGIGTNLIGTDPSTTTNVISGMSYKAFGAARTINYGNNRTATLSYSLDLMRLTQMEVARPDGTDKIVNHSYFYTENGLISSTLNGVDSAYSSSYGYNYRNQLLTANRQGSTLTYTQDHWGNLTSVHDFPTNSYTTFGYATSNGVPTTNRLQSLSVSGNTTNFSYDNAGNMTGAGSTTYQWDAANRLKSVNNGSLGSYGYDGNGKRVKKSESGVTTYYVISSVLGSVMEVTATGVQRAYVMSGGSVVAQLNPNGSFYWIHLDHLGSGRKMTDSSGNMVYRAEFDPYGKLLYEWSNPTNLNTRKFTGYERDAATNLDYAQARMYANDWGRFMSPDPAGMKAVIPYSPQSLNRYSYTDNNPVNRVDRTGLGWVVELTCTIIMGKATCWFSFGWVDGPGPGPNPYYDPRNYLPSSIPAGSGYSGEQGRGGTKQSLSREKQEEFDTAKEEALDFSRDCKTYLGNALQDIGLSMDDLAKAINAQKPYDATSSTINVVAAGIIPAGYSNPLIPNITSLFVKEFFARSKEIGFNNEAATGYATTATRNDVYYNPANINSRNIIHEALHSLTGKNDADLAAALGRSKQEALTGSAWIVDRLFKWGCGSD